MYSSPPLYIRAFFSAELHMLMIFTFQRPFSFIAPSFQRSYGKTDVLKERNNRDRVYY